MNVMVTGGAGFIASHIVDALVKNKHRVIIVDNLSSGKKDNINPEAIFYKIDICNPKLEDVFRKHKIDIVIHHAAQIDVRESVRDPVFDAKVNILGSLNILENCVRCKVKKIIFASTGGAIYGEVPGKPASESTMLRPLSPYGVAKCSIEYYIRYYEATCGFPYTILRYGNVYGDRQDPHGEAGVVAIFTQKMLDGDQPAIFGDGKQLRDYVYVGDVVRANLLAIGKGKNQILNIGTGKGTSVNVLYEKLSRLTAFNRKPAYLPAMKGELQNSRIDPGKARKVLGWVPLVSLDEGFASTVKYFKTLRTDSNSQSRF